MKIGDTLFFSPKHAFRDLDFTNPDQIALAFQDRVDGFYFAPAERLIGSNDAFAAGLVIFAGVEFLARASSESEPSAWLADNLKIDHAVTAKVWEYFRHGLIARRAGQGLSAILVRDRQGGRRIRRHLRHQPRLSVAGSKDSVPGPLRPDRRKPKTTRD